MKKVLYSILALIMLCATFYTVAAEPIDPDSISAEYVYAYEVDSGGVIFAKNEDISCAEASTTKMMTALIIQEAINNNTLDPAKIYTVAADSAIQELPGDSSLLRGSGKRLKLGEEMAVKDLLTGMMLMSGNDAAIVLAENFAGNKTAFVNLMNERAQELGMTKTVFRNPHGLDNEQHRTTAEDFAKLATACYNTPGFIEMTKRETYELPATNKTDAPQMIGNTNRLIRDREGETAYRYEYANGIKTGNTDIARYCVVASAEKDGTSIIIVMFGDGSNNGLKRWTDCTKIFDYGFDNFKNIDIKTILTGISIEENVAGANIDAEKGLSGKAVLTPQIDDDSLPYYGLIANTDAISSGNNKFTAHTNFTTGLTAPLAAGTVVGTVKYTLGEEGSEGYYETAEFPLIVSVDVPELGQTAIPTSPPPDATPAPPDNPGGSWLNLALIALGIVVGLGVLALGVIIFLRAHRKPPSNNHKRFSNDLSGNFSSPAKKLANKDWDFDFDDSYPPPDPDLLTRVRRGHEDAPAPSETLVAPSLVTPVTEPVREHKTAEEIINERIAKQVHATVSEPVPIADEMVLGEAQATKSESPAQTEPQKAAPLLRGSNAAGKHAQGVHTLRGTKGYMRRKR